MADDDKTEKATPKKRRDARKKGDVLMSKDVVTVASLIITFSTLWMVGPSMVAKMEAFMFYVFDSMLVANSSFIVEEGEAIARTFVSTFFGVILIPLLVTIIAAVVATGYQTKWLIAFDSIKPSFKKLNPIQGVKKLFSLKGWVDALKNLFKISILLYVVYQFYMARVFTFGTYYYIHPAVAGAQILQYIILLVMQISIAFIAIASFDYGYSWYEYEKKLKMSKHDIKEEHKQAEGDPKVKAKIKQKQFQMAQQRMMTNVKAADVIIRNPTHYAVALRYKKGMDAVPLILAMGEDELAFRIITIGERFEIPIVENREAARALYAQGQVGQSIPPDLYVAVSKIITVVMGITKENIGQYVTPEK